MTFLRTYGFFLHSKKYACKVNTALQPACVCVCVATKGSKVAFWHPFLSRGPFFMCQLVRFFHFSNLKLKPRDICISFEGKPHFSTLQRMKQEHFYDKVFKISRWLVAHISSNAISWMPHKMIQTDIWIYHHHVNSFCQCNFQNSGCDLHFTVCIITHDSPPLHVTAYPT